MSMTDPIADMLTRIRNAISRKYESVRIPCSKQKIEIARILKEEGFIRSYAIAEDGNHKVLVVDLKYSGRNQSVIQGLRRTSRPGLRLYAGKDAIPRVQGGLGLAILSTSQGVLTGRESRRRQIGGEVLCYVW
jgi:small subunit ribosomal protein S8